MDFKDYYSTLGVPSFFGRTLDEQDEKNHQRVAVLSYPFCPGF